MKLKRKESNLKHIVAQAQGAKTRLKYAKADLDTLRQKNKAKCQAVGLQDFDFCGYYSVISVKAVFVTAL